MPFDCLHNIQCKSVLPRVLIVLSHFLKKLIFLATIIIAFSKSNHFIYSDKPLVIEMRQNILNNIENLV